MDQLPPMTKSDLLGGPNEFKRDGDSNPSAEGWLKTHEQEVTVAVGAALGLAAIAWGAPRLMAAAGRKAAGKVESEIALATSEKTLAKVAAPPSRSIASELAASSGGKTGVPEILAARMSMPSAPGVTGGTRDLLAAIETGQAGKLLAPQSQLEHALEMLSESAAKTRAAEAAAAAKDGAFQLATGIPNPSHHEVGQWVRLTTHDAGPASSAPLVDQSMRELLGFDPPAGSFALLDEALLNAERANPANPYTKFMPGLKFEMPGLSVRAKKEL